MRRAAIVGGGLAGLATALRLQCDGWQVTLFEAGETFGGKMNVLRKDGFRFDTGPSLITMPWVFEELFTAAGSALAEHAELQPLHPLAEYRFDDGTRFEYTSQLPEWLATLKRVAPGDTTGFFRFLNLGARLFEVSRETFFKRSPYETPAKPGWRTLRNMPVRHGWGNYQRTVEHFFRSPHLRQLYGRYPTYVGSSPWRSPATLAVISYIEFAFGGYAVKGGLYRIVEGIVALAKQRGVELCPNAPVARVLSHHGIVEGVELESGTRVAADVVVMNGDDSAKADHRSMSGFVMLIGLRRPLKIHQHTVCFSADYGREFTQLFDELNFPEDPTVYVNAPQGENTLFIMANAPPVGTRWDERMTAQARTRVLARLRKSGFPEFEEDIAVTDIWTPERFETTYRARGGSIYGTDSHGWRNAFLRPRNQDRHIRGLFRAGGSTHPGGGTPTVLMSAEIASRLIGRAYS